MQLLGIGTALKILLLPEQLIAASLKRSVRLVVKPVKRVK
jgi:hypothetical protein